MNDSSGTIQLATQPRSFASLVADLAPGWPVLPDKPEETPTAALRALWFAAAGQPRSVRKAMEGDLPVLSEDAEKKLNQLVEQRLSGTPLAHLVGWQNFMGLEFKTSPQALIPRKETEILGYAALECLRDIISRRGSARVIDVCTGSGNLAISLAAHEPACQVFAADLCEDAVALARENAAFHKLSDRVQFRAGDLFVPFEGGDFDANVDLVVCNPPYLSTQKVAALPREIGSFEPKAAFDAGSFGLAIISRLGEEAPRFLKPDSRLCFEVGLGQGPFVASRLERSGSYKTVKTAVDAAGEVRALIAST